MNRCRTRRPWFRTARFWVPTSIGAVLLGLVACGAVIAFEASAVRDDLEDAQASAARIQVATAQRDIESLPQLSDELENATARAVARTESPLWRAGEFVPALGENLRAVRIVAESVDGFSRQVVSPAVEFVSSFTLTRDPATGAFDTAPISAARDILEAATRNVSDASTALAGVNTDLTLVPVGEAVAQYESMLGEMAELLDQAGSGVAALSALLGVDGPATIVLAFLNNAELAALGGGPAAQTLLTVDNGTVTVVEHVTSYDFPQGVPADVLVDESAHLLYNEILTAHINGAFSRPDLPTAAKILGAQWQRIRGIQPDGVISLDPIALAMMLEVTGPVTISSGEVLDSDNAVSLLLNQAYFLYDGRTEADDFFQRAANAVFTRVLAADYDLWAMAEALARAAENGSLMVWSSDPDTNALTAGTRLQGTLPTTNDSETVLGVYFRDRSSSKVDFYLHADTVVTTNTCDADAPTYTVETRIWFDFPPGIELPVFVVGELYDFYRTEVFAYGPVGGSVIDAAVLEAGTATATGPIVDDLGRPAVKYQVDLVRGQTGVVRAAFAGVPGEYGPTLVRSTPMINPMTVTMQDAPCG
ncbi:DUF4012 domain-containing protein [Agromyces albus]|uniref:DUF4012 domain-containing protein n=1 Tax=Agromyces albus TaxID=205332 RepID=A0A4Q2L6S8_9MICO|nr:DUF4012 domain-containing protein [Agromyces albus]RXZ72213.1 DUF4012 domain-containing protein [Agromyces albus]